MHRFAKKAVCLSLLLGVLLCGCTPSNNAGVAVSDSELGVIPVITSPKQVTFPIWAYLPDIDQTVALMQTDVKLVNKCIADGGLDAQITFEKTDLSGSSKPREPVGVASIRAWVKGFRDADVTRNSMWGFFRDSGANGYEQDSKGSDIVLSHGADDPIVEDCMARVEAVTPSGMVAMDFMVSSLPDGGVQFHPEDSRYLKVVKLWSDCMTGKGFKYNTPIDAYNGEGQFARAVAEADLQCKRDTNLVGVAVAVQSIYEQEYIDSHRDALAAQQQHIADYIAGRVEIPATAPPAQIDDGIPTPTPSIGE